MTNCRSHVFLQNRQNLVQLAWDFIKYPPPDIIYLYNHLFFYREEFQFSGKLQNILKSVFQLLLRGWNHEANSKMAKYIMTFVKDMFDFFFKSHFCYQIAKGIFFESSHF